MEVVHFELCTEFVSNTYAHACTQARMTEAEEEEEEEEEEEVPVQPQDSEHGRQQIFPLNYGPDGMRWWRTAMEAFGLEKEPHELKSEDLVGKRFTSLEEAELFYNMYAQMTGFTVRKGHMRKGPDGRVKYREWLCSREGQRDTKHLQRVDRVRAARAITRTGCLVKLRVAHNRKSGQWVVKQFRTQHSHPVATMGCAQFLQSNRVLFGPTPEVSKPTKAAAGNTTCHAMEGQRGGSHKTGFSSKDLYNKIGSSNRVELAEGDAARAIGYLEHKADHDVNFYGVYSYDQHKRVKNIVWADSRCQADYHAFGRNVAFDTTYEANGKPLVVWIGLNPHFRATIFGFALLVDKTVETFNWVTKAFMDCMKDSCPETVLTAGDDAMRAAITELMPGAVHRLCKWHLEKNALKNTHEPEFARELRRLMFRYYTEEQFEDEWSKLIERFGLENNEWCKSLYKEKKSWAETFLRGHYFGGLTTAPRSESMNSLLKGKVTKGMTLAELVRALDLTLSGLRHQEAKEDFDSLNPSPVICETIMVEIEKQAASIYTRSMFYRVRHQIKREGKYIVFPGSRSDDVLDYTITKYGDNSSKRLVKYNTVTGEFQCQCNYFPTTGVPCRHIFATMKVMNVTKIPDSLIQWQWTMRAREKLSKIRGTALGCNHTCSEESARFGYINSLCAQMAYYASKSDALFKMAEDVMRNGLAQLKNSWGGTGDRLKQSQKQSPNPNQTQNPSCTKTKETAPRRGTCAAPRSNSNGRDKMTCKRKRTNMTESPRSHSLSDEEEDAAVNLVNLADKSDKWPATGIDNMQGEEPGREPPRRGLSSIPTVSGLRIWSATDGGEFVRSTMQGIGNGSIEHPPSDWIKLT